MATESVLPKTMDGEELWRFLNPQDSNWYVQIMQGDSYVTSKPNEVLTTVLGSCIAACIRDPKAGVGGMNHFLLPDGRSDGRDARRFGVNAMEVLINGLIKLGGARERFEAKLFGGANVLPQLSDVGSRNVAFAKKFLGDEGIKLVGGDMGGSSPRRVQFWPVSGRVRQQEVRTDRKRLVECEISEARHEPLEAAASHDVELF